MGTMPEKMDEQETKYEGWAFGIQALLSHLDYIKFYAPTEAARKAVEETTKVVESWLSIRP